MMSGMVPMVWADGHQGSIEHCAACGRRLRGEPQLVEVVCGGSYVVAPGSDVDVNDPGYMGFFAVGPECAKKHFRGFTSSVMR